MKQIFTICLWTHFCLQGFSQNAKIQLGLPIGHEAFINSAEFSPDGKYIVTASGDNTAKIWNVETGLLLHSLEGHFDQVNSAGYSPDGKRIVTASDDSTVGIWDAETGKLLQNLTGNVGWVISAQYSPDGKIIATTSLDDTAKIWNAETGSLLHNLAGHSARIFAARFSPNGKELVTASWDKTAKIWDIQTGLLLHDLTGHRDSIQSVGYSPDGKRIVTASFDGTAKIWDAATGGLLHDLRGHTGAVVYAQFSPDGKRIVTVSRDGTAKIWDVESGRLLYNLKGQAGQIIHARYSPDSKSIITTSQDRTVEMWNAGTGRNLYEIKGQNDTLLDSGMDRFFAALFSPDGKKIVTSLPDFKAAIRDAKTGQAIHDLAAHSFWVNSAAFSPDGKTIVTASNDKVARIWDAETGKLLRILKGHILWVVSAQYSPDGKKIVTASWDGTAKTWDTETGKLLLDLRGCGDSVESARFSPDGKNIVTASNDRTAKIWDAETGRLLGILTGHTGYVEWADYSPDGKKIVTASDDSTVKIWDAKTGKLLLNLKGHTARVTSAKFSPDGKRVLTASDDYIAKIWNAKTGLLQNNLTGHNEEINFADFSPDGQKIVTASFDNTAKIWDAHTGNLLHNLTGHTLYVNFAQFSPDGKRIVTASGDSKCKLWDVASGTELLSWMAIDSSDWIVTSPSGLFDASDGAMEKMYWVKRLEVFNFAQLKKRYWEPDLWKKVTEGDTLRDVRGMDEIASPPDVELGKIRNYKLPVTLKKRDGGYGRVIVLINGKEVQADARGGGFDTSQPTQQIMVDLKNNFLLIPGQKNTITVKSWSEDGFVEGRGLYEEYTAPGDSQEAKPAFYAVICGINQYSSPSVRQLKFPVQDAQSMSTAVQLGAQNYFLPDSTHIYTLTNRGKLSPTKENIEKVFDSIKHRAKPQDILMVYLSGHGIATSGEAGDFYYLTSDAYTFTQDPVILKKEAISTEELTEWIKKIPALKQVMVIDACGSGMAVDKMVDMKSDDADAYRIKSIDDMKDRTGMFIISGCAADAVSFEANQFGQGLLTYSLLQAMKGAALEDGKLVDVSRIFHYAEKKVPDFAREFGQVQQPRIHEPERGSFAIGMLTEKDREQIPLANRKPIFIQSNLQNIDAMDDDLNLSEMLDEALTQIEAKSIDPPLRFVDAKQLPDAYKISGNYKKTGTTWEIKYKIKDGAKETDYGFSAATEDELKSKLKEDVSQAVAKK